ncbi:MAG: class II fructose-bisphosphate aldolase [Holophagaceae bacterium]|uniref:Fructose-bisphosphate aldolase n=1 Tax=Candidatus Geothrix skivensis TaxID=2954439 RepID=A0A9D7XL46_9BACT|nr:class II fructose-bisphosphate aldolase [Candidatus Geothrix skivensis]
MPVVSPAQYTKMLEVAKQAHYAFPAFNVTSTESANAVLLGLKTAKADGIVQISTGGAEFLSGLGVKSMAQGAIALADYVRFMADHYDVNIALHTDHCHPKHLESFVLPLIQETERRRAAGQPNLYNAHMFDGSELALSDNIAKSAELLKRCAASEIILEVEIGVVGGEEDGHDTSHVGKEKLYTTPEDMVAVHKGLAPIGRYMLAATFGNVHGVYKPGNVVLKPSILRDGQSAIAAACGGESSLLVFHGGSGSSLREIHETLDYGVIKMNIDTDTQYAFTRAIADHMFKNYDGVLKVDGEVGNKKAFDPRPYMKKAEQSMADRVVRACEDLRCAGKSLGRI